MIILKKLLLLTLILIAQAATAQFSSGDESSEETFDPFSDYTEYTQTTEEEADIHFFRHGRLLNLETLVGQRNFTSTLGQLYAPGISYGLGLTYFFDMRFAGLLAFSTSDHAFQFTTNNGTTTGNVSMTFLGFAIKYFLNTDTLIRPIAALNPYWIFGFNQTYRSLTLSASSLTARDNTMGFEAGAGIEIQVLRKQAYIGFQGIYRYFNFIDESKNLIDPISLTAVPVKPMGDSFDVGIKLGVNF